MNATQLPPNQDQGRSETTPRFTPPAQLVTSLRDNPLVIGLLCLISRLFLLGKEATPLSPADIAAFDPSLSESRIRRALIRLEKSGGIIAERACGTKSRFRPTWGFVNGKPRPWDPLAKSYGRPWHIATVQIDLRIIDLLIGRLAADRRLPAQVDRFITAPLISLADIGAYLLLRTGQRVSAAAMRQLEAVGLLRDGQPCELPNNDEDVLRWISQAQLLGQSDVTLSAKGLRRLGIKPDQPPAVPEYSGQALLFLSPEMARNLPHPGGDHDGHPDGDHDGSGPQKYDAKTGDLASPEAPKSDRPSEQPDMAWNLKQLKHDPTPTTQVAGFVQKPPRRKQKTDQAPLPTTPTAELLRSLGARSTTIRELCHINLQQAEKIVAYARTRSDILNLTAWVVNALRDHAAHGWCPPAPPAPARSLNIEKYTTGEYAQYFVHDMPEGDEPALAEPQADDSAPPPSKDSGTLEEVDAELQGYFSRCFESSDYEYVKRLRLIDGGEMPIFSCPDEETREYVGGKSLYYIELFCRGFGWEMPPLLVLHDSIPPAS